MISQTGQINKENKVRRDQFAMYTLNGLVSARAGALNPVEMERFAKDSWAMADLMLKTSKPETRKK